MEKSVIYYLFIICFISCLANMNSNATTKKDFVQKGNKIDSLKTTEEVIQFAKYINPDFARENFGRLHIKTTDSIIKELKNCDLYKSWDIKNWQKIDLNNDGRTDLIFTALHYSNYAQYAIINMELNKYKIFILSNNIDYACKILKPILINNKNELLVNNYKTDAETISKEQTIHFIDTLTYKFDSFIELSDKPANYDIESIKFISDYNFEIEIDNNQNAHYKCLDKFNVSNLKGDFYKEESNIKISPVYFNEIKKMMDYISIRDLSNEYILDGYDFPTVRLEIRFKNGSVKKIQDYGYQGTYGLKAIYDKMTNVVLETHWD